MEVVAEEDLETTTIRVTKSTRALVNGLLGNARLIAKFAARGLPVPQSVDDLVRGLILLSGVPT